MLCDWLWDGLKSKWKFWLDLGENYLTDKWPKSSWDFRTLFFHLKIINSLNSFYGLSLSSPGGAFPLLGNVGALKLYNSAIDSSEITSVENQLMTKFGI